MAKAFTWISTKCTATSLVDCISWLTVYVSEEFHSSVMRNSLNLVTDQAEPCKFLSMSFHLSKIIGVKKSVF